MAKLLSPRCKECPGPNQGMPFGCVWRVGNKDYPVGVGRTKQDARQNAAKYALERLFLKTGEENNLVEGSLEKSNVLSLKLWCWYQMTQFSV